MLVAIFLYNKTSTPTIQAKLSSRFLKFARKHLLTGYKVFERGIRASKKPTSYGKKFPPNLHVEVLHIPNGQAFELLTAEQPAKKVLLQLHGGGYAIPTWNMYRRMAVRYLQKIGCDVATLNYRVLPNTFPAALEDAVAAYELLVDKYGAENITVIGDSAGGHLSVTLILKLIEMKKTAPKAVVLMSPWIDLTCSGSSYKSKSGSDPLFCYETGEECQLTKLGQQYIGDADPKNPLVCPIHADFAGFPPVLLHVGTNEMLESDSDLLAHKMREAGVDLTFKKWEGLFHVFQMFQKYIPEARQAQDEIFEFIRSRM